MSVSEPLGATVRTRYKSSATDGLHVVESVPNGRAFRRTPRPARSSRMVVEASPVLPSSAIHELRTPLTSIHGYAQVLQRGLADNPRAANGLAVIVRESGRLTQMLTELSDLAHLSEPDDDEDVCQRREVDLRELVEAVAESVASRDTDGHDISISGQAQVVCDSHHLALAVHHVLANATRYAPAGTRITLDLEQSEDSVRVFIADEGIGICDADAERVYGPFERGANAREFGTRGLGLGLFIARRAIAIDGGTLSHAARQTAGTIFAIELPRG